MSGTDKMDTGCRNKEMVFELWLIGVYILYILR